MNINEGRNCLCSKFPSIILYYDNFTIILYDDNFIQYHSSRYHFHWAWKVSTFIQWFQDTNVVWHYVILLCNERVFRATISLIIIKYIRCKYQKIFMILSNFDDTKKSSCQIVMLYNVDWHERIARSRFFEGETTTFYFISYAIKRDMARDW